MANSVREKIEDLLQQPVRSNSVNVMFHCPFHEDRVPSLSIHMEEGVWQCFSCGSKGGLERLAAMLGDELDQDFRYDRLLGSLDRQPEQEKDFATLGTSLRHEGNTRKGQRAISDYLRAKGLSSDVSERFGIGYDPRRDTIALPYWGKSGVKAIRYRGRDGSKYFEPGSKHVLYGQRDPRRASTVILCEGESDTHAVWSDIQGYDGVEAYGAPGMGVSEATWTLWGLDFLHASRIVCLFDADAAGDRGAAIIMRVFGDKAIRVSVEGANDVCDYRKNGGNLIDLLERQNIQFERT